MLMAAATHTHTHLRGSAAHSSSSTSPISPPTPPWHPAVLVPNQHQHAALYDDLDLVVTPSPTPSATTPPTPHRLRPAVSRSRRAGRKQQRRPRPSRRLPTTYISADAASFRRMVHQVTGADDLPLPLPGPAATTDLRLCRQAPPPSRAALTTTKTMTLLPTLDTSAFLLGAARCAGGGATATPARPGASCFHGGSAAVAVERPGAALQAEDVCGRGGVRGGGEYSCSSRCAGGGGGEGFPNLESWDDDALF